MCDKPVCTIYYSGAEVSLITESVWKHIKIKCPEKVLTLVKTKVSGWSDSVKSLRGVTEILIKIKSTDEEEYSVPVGITKDSELPCCVLLGNNFLTEYDLTVDFGKCVIKRSCRKGSVIIHTYIIPNVEEEAVVQVHILE